VLVSVAQRRLEGKIMTHRSAMSTRHAALEAQLAREATKPLPDSLAMARLKKEKLRLKEQLAG